MMTEERPNLITEHQLNQYIYRLVNLENNDLLVLLDSRIKCLKSPHYRLQDALDISFSNSKIDAICLWKNNHIIVKTPEKFYIIELFLDNTNYRILSQFNMFEKVFLRYQKMIPINKYSNLLLNISSKFVLLEEYQPNTFQVLKIFNHKLGFNSYIQVRKNEILCNSSNDKKVFFINIHKGIILKEIENIQVYIEDIDSFCKINKNIVGMGGDYHEGIYLFDINKRELIYHYKKDYRGYNSLLRIGKNKFLGESYNGRCYGESDDESEEFYCTHFFEYDEKEKKIKPPYKESVDRIYELKRRNFIKFNRENKIAYSTKDKFYIENI